MSARASDHDAVGMVFPVAGPAGSSMYCIMKGRARAYIADADSMAYLKKRIPMMCPVSTDVDRFLLYLKEEIKAACGRYPCSLSLNRQLN